MLQYLLLPSELTEFERNHLKRTLRVALAFFWLNVPLFMGVAFMSGTGVLMALVLSSLVMAGPTVAWLTLPNPRHVSVAVGIAAMCMGGLLVHFGQGPMQIEMHFYFFSLLAVLSAFGNPMVIVAAAVTVTLHHTVIWYFLPQSVFNYDASFIVILVHAAFVVVESIAAVYMARSYFDNVIGLEKKVAKRTAQLDVANRSMRLVMQHVNQGLVTIDRSGTMASERSARIEEWLGSSSTDSMVDYLRKVDAGAAEWFELGFQDLLDGFMPLEVTLDQLPQTVTQGDRTLKVEYIPIQEPDSDDDFDQLLVVLSDVTTELAQASAEARQKQAISLIHHLLDDPTGVREFLESGAEMLQAMKQTAEQELVRRVIHTLKGNSLSLDLHHFGDHLHELEEALQEQRRPPSEDEWASLTDEWERIVETVERLAPSGDVSLRIEPESLDALMEAVESGETAEDLLGRLRALRHGSPAPRLQRLGEQARRLAGRLGKELEVVVDDGGIRVPLDELRPLWSSLTHALRNAVDHGIETPDERAASGKASAGTLTLALADTPDGITVTIADDGRGIDWEALKQRASAKGVESDEEIDLLFADGLSTRDEASLVSGRGVGMSALRDSIEGLGGSIHVESELRIGTRMTFTVPHGALHSAAA